MADAKTNATTVILENNDYYFMINWAQGITDLFP